MLIIYGMEDQTIDLEVRDNQTQGLIDVKQIWAILSTPKVFIYVYETGLTYIALAILKLMIFLILPSKQWGV